MASPLRNLKLDDSGDLSITAGQLDTVSGLVAVAQAVRTALSLFRGEWFLDNTAGIPYFDNILVHSPNLTVVRAIIRAAVLDVPGVAQVSTLELDFDKDARQLQVDLGIVADLGELVSVNLQLGVP